MYEVGRLIFKLINFQHNLVIGSLSLGESESPDKCKAVQIKLGQFGQKLRIFQNLGQKIKLSGFKKELEMVRISLILFAHFLGPKFRANRTSP